MDNQRDSQVSSDKSSTRSQNNTKFPPLNSKSSSDKSSEKKSKKRENKRSPLRYKDEERKSVLLLAAFLCKVLPAESEEFIHSEAVDGFAYGRIAIKQLEEESKKKFSDILLDYVLPKSNHCLSKLIPINFDIIFLKENSRLETISMVTFTKDTVIFYNGADYNISNPRTKLDRLLGSFWISQESLGTIEIVVTNSIYHNIEEVKSDVVKLKGDIQNIIVEQDKIKAGQEDIKDTLLEIKEQLRKDREQSRKEAEELREEFRKEAEELREEFRKQGEEFRKQGEELREELRKQGEVQDYIQDFIKKKP